MSKLFLVRHGQARLFTNDYDRLSRRGEHQSALVGRHWLEHGQTIDRAYCGTLVRQRRTGEKVAAVLAERGIDFPDLKSLPGLDEYPGEDILAALVPVIRATDAEVDRLAQEFERAEAGAERYRGLHRLLESIMERWIREDFDRNDAPDLPRWQEFADGVRDALAAIRREAGGGSSVAVFTSGGPIGVAVQSVLDAPDVSAGRINWRVFNASITEFTFSGPRWTLDSFNVIQHIPADIRTYR